MQIEIIVYDACGSEIAHDFVEADTATVEQVNEMVSMIGTGTPAHIAAVLAKLPVP